MHDIYYLLQREHHKLKNIVYLIDRTNQINLRKKYELINMLHSKFLQYKSLKEQFLYNYLENKEPACQSELNISKKMQARLEHCLNNLTKTSNIKDELWILTFNVFKLYFMVHINREEKLLFKLAKRVLPAEKSVELADYVQCEIL